MLFILIAIFIFGVLIATHELGHFLTAKMLGVKVNEFSIGMGPAVFKKEKGETLYSIRLLPIGGYCAMEGEDDDSADPHAFGRAKGWKKILILSAGAAMNFMTGLLILAVLLFQLSGIVMPVITGFLEGYNLENCGLQVGDVVLSVEHRNMFSLYGRDKMSEVLNEAGDTVDFVIVRDGERLTLNNVFMPRQQRIDSEGKVTNFRGVSKGITAYDAGIKDRLVYSWYGALEMVDVVWSGLGALLSGDVGLRELSGPVGIVNTMTEVGEQSATAVDAAINLAFFAAMIAVNLAVMNLLPVPALDGGRIFFLLLNGILYGLFRKRIAAKYEGYVHMTGLVVLMALMLMVTLSDVGKIFGH